jgi:hypothetical protein
MPESPPLVAARTGGGAGLRDRLVRRWAAGSLGYAVPDSVGEWLEVLATTHIRHPAPTNWRGLQDDVLKLADRELSP